MKKLRNKKTGEIAKNVSSFDTRDFKIGIEYEDSLGYSNRVAYDSIADLNEEWEDYAPAEPLITTDGVRDAVYSWASSLEIREVRCKKRMKGVEVTTFEAFRLGSAPRIEFASWSIDADVTDGAIYTIADLCGEEDEAIWGK